MTRLITAFIITAGIASTAWAATGSTRCRCASCATATADIGPAIRRVVAEIERRTGRTVRITSGLRCATHNRKVGGVPGSRHVTGKAVDITIAGMKPEEIAAVARGIPAVRYVSVYKDGHVHVDTH